MQEVYTVTHYFADLYGVESIWSNEADAIAEAKRLAEKRRGREFWSVDAWELNKPDGDATQREIRIV